MQAPILHRNALHAGIDLADGNFSNGYTHHVDLDSKGWKAFLVLALDIISCMYVAILLPATESSLCWSWFWVCDQDYMIMVMSQK